MEWGNRSEMRNEKREQDDESYSPGYGWRLVMDVWLYKRSLPMSWR